MNKLTLEDLEVADKRVLMRVDFNVPMKEGEISDDSRIMACLPTIEWLQEKKARIVLMSHLGRPKGDPDPRYSLEPVARRLAKLLSQEVFFVGDCVGSGPLEVSESLEPGQVLLLENLRFHREEEENDPGFSKQLAQMGEIYVNNAFGTAHRAHASTVGVTAHFRQAAAGFLMEQELRYLTQAVEVTEKGLLVKDGKGKQRLIEAGTIILAGPRKSTQDLASSLEYVCDELYVIGDAIQPRFMHRAIHEGYILGARL